MRFLLSVIILTLIITYVVIPFVQYIKRLVVMEGKRIDKSLTGRNEDK